MAQILVRNLSESTKRYVQRRAKRNGRSMEAEVREILNLATLEEAKNSEVGFGTATAALFRNCGLQEGEEFPELRGFKLEPIHFDE